MKCNVTTWLTMAAAMAVVAGMWCPEARATVINFEDLSFTSGDYENGANLSGSFSSGGATFNNYYSVDPDWGPWWESWAYSKAADPTYQGSNNQFSAKTTSALANTYGIAYVGWYTAPTITFATPTTVSGFDVTNTVYAHYSMLNGDPPGPYCFAKKFGGASGNDADWFLLTIRGTNTAGETKVVDFNLADYQFTDNLQDYILKDWTWVDLTGLGDNVCKLEFSLSSTDNDPYNGMCTPAYFAMDNLTTAPEPSTLALLATGGLAMLVGGWRRARWRAQ